MSGGGKDREKGVVVLKYFENRCNFWIKYDEMWWYWCL